MESKFSPASSFWLKVQLLYESEIILLIAPQVNNLRVAQGNS